MDESNPKKQKRQGTTIHPIFEGRDIDEELVHHSKMVPDDVRWRYRLLCQKIGLMLILLFLKEMDEERQRKIDENWRIIEENKKRERVCHERKEQETTPRSQYGH